MIRIEATLERIVFANAETHFCVGEFTASSGRDRIVAAGVMPSVQCGETLILEGDWSDHPRFGRQLKVERFESKLPATVHGIRKYLGSGLVPGIGKTYAGKIVDHFGEETFTVISEDSGRLREIPGIGKQRARQIKKAWEEQRAVREVMIFLQTYGISSTRCVRLVRKYGEQTKEILSRHPYRLADEVEGIGFKSADKIARNLGIDTRGGERVEAGLLYALSKEEEEGHTCVPRQRLVETAAELLEIEEKFVEPHLERLLESNRILGSANGLLQHPSLSRAETRAARALKDLLAGKSSLPPIRVEKAIDWAAERMRIEFAPGQKEAIHMALTERVTLLTGGPGTGKTTILRAIVEIVQAKKGKILLGSPTGRASQRLAESTGMAARTLHRLLEFDPAEGGFQRDENRPLKGDLVVIDEASMIDTWLAASLFAALPPECHLVLVGDVDQLPSVGPGRVLQDLVQSGFFSTVRLNQIFRQEASSSIVSIAHDILRGWFQLPAEAMEEGMEHSVDFRFVPEADPEACADRVERIVRYLHEKRRGGGGAPDFQILTPMNRGPVGVRELNSRLQATLNPRGDGLVFGDNRYAPGDKVIQMRNNYDKGLFNGDVGLVVAADSAEGVLRVRFNGQEVFLDRSDLPDLQLAYAITIHKSQGSEYPVVVIPLLKQHYLLLRRNLVYTGITRGKEKVIVVGDPAAYAMAVRNRDDQKRNTLLLQRLEEVGS